LLAIDCETDERDLHHALEPATSRKLKPSSAFYFQIVMENQDTVGIAYLYRPWAPQRYIEDALRNMCEVEYFGTPYKGRPGFSPEESILDLVENKARDYAGILFNEDCLFGALTELDCPTAIWFPDYWPGDYHRLRYARLFDHVFVSQKDWLDDFVSAGCKQVNWLPFACDLEFHRDYQIERSFDVGFVGNTNQSIQADRLRLLMELSKRYKMNDFSKPVYLQEMARIYSQSKIVVNMPNRGGFNMRVFEAMACGALLLTEDTRNGQKELFTAGVQLDVYKSKQELFEKIDYYLANEERRREIAEAGQAEVRSKHRYSDRATTIYSSLKNAPDERYRTTDADEILRIYTLFHARRSRVQPLLKSLVQSRCSISTRTYIGARLLKTAINVVRS
jgi:hypothetical protein